MVQWNHTVRGLCIFKVITMTSFCVNQKENKLTENINTEKITDIICLVFQYVLFSVSKGKFEITLNKKKKPKNEIQKEKINCSILIYIYKCVI